MARPLRRGSFALAVSLATAAVLLASCRRPALRAELDAAPDAADAADAVGRAAFDANLPETVTIVLEAGVDPDGRRVVVRTAGDGEVPPMIGLPRPCTDRTLGVVTFVQEDSKVLVASSKGFARATCVRMDEHKLLCDWVDKDGNPTVTRRALSYGPKTKIGGSYDAKHAFACPAQNDPEPAKPSPPPPRRRSSAPARR